MTRDQQMRKAMELLAPAKRERTKCRADISSALDIIAMMGKSDEVFADARSKTATRGGPLIIMWRVGCWPPTKPCSQADMASQRTAVQMLGCVKLLSLPTSRV